MEPSQRDDSDAYRTDWDATITLDATWAQATLGLATLLVPVEKNVVGFYCADIALATLWSQGAVLICANWLCIQVVAIRRCVDQRAVIHGHIPGPRRGQIEWQEQLRERSVHGETGAA